MTEIDPTKQKNTQEIANENIEAGKETSTENPEQVAENLTTKTTEQTDSAIAKADTRMDSAENMGATKEIIAEGKALLSPVQQKMENLKTEYATKFAEVTKKYEATIAEVASLSALEKIKGKKQADVEKSQAEELLNQAKSEEEVKLTAERQTEVEAERIANEAKEKLEKENKEAQELEVSKTELTNLNSYKTELTGLQNQKTEIEGLLATTGDTDIDAMRGELETQLGDINKQVAEKEAVVKRLEETKQKVEETESKVNILSQDGYDKKIDEKQNKFKENISEIEGKINDEADFSNASRGMQNYARLTKNLNNFKKYLGEEYNSEKNIEDKNKEKAILRVEAKEKGIKVPDSNWVKNDENMVKLFEERAKEAEGKKEKNLKFIDEIGEIPSGWKAGSLENYTRGLSKEEEEKFSTEDYFKKLEEDNNKFYAENVDGKHHGEFEWTPTLEVQGLGIAALEDGNIELATKAIGSVSKVSSIRGRLLEKYNQALNNLSEEKKGKFLTSLDEVSSKQRDFKKEYEKKWGSKV